MKQVFNLIIASILSLSLIACGNFINPDNAYIVKSRFNSNRAKSQLVFGEQTLIGQGLLQGPSETTYSCAGKSVNLIPSNPYSIERMTAQFGHWSGGVTSTPMIFGGKEEEFREYMHSTTCDSDGRFTFENIKRGEYYLETSLADLDDNFPGGVPVTSLIRISHRPNQRQFYLVPRNQHVDEYVLANNRLGGVNDNEILGIQQSLLQLGLDSGIPNGKLHKKAREAIRQFQRVSSMPVTGFADQQIIQEIQKTIEKRKPWTANTIPIVWTLVATSHRSAHGVSAGRDQLEAFSKALRKCELAREQDSGTFMHEPCTARFLSNIDDEACASLVVQYYTWQKHFGFSEGVTFSPQGLSYDAYQNAYEACGSNSSQCRSSRFIGSKMEYTYCSSDFR